ncbi:unnamed protein product [Rhizophagus irregularis]|nr:unnamed protein product [Rhizophagus irregularis]
MIRFGSRVGFRSTEPQRFLRVGFRVPKNGKPRFVSIYESWFRAGFLVPKNGKEPRFDQVGSRIPKNGKSRFASEFRRTEKRELRFDRVGFLVPKNGKEPRFVQPFGIFRRMKKPRFVRMEFGQTGEPRFVSSGGLRTNEGIKIRSGRFRTNGRTKIRKFGWASEERKPKDKDSIGRLPKNENPKIKIRSGLSKKRKKTKDLVSVFRRTEKTKIRSVGFQVLKNNGKPRFVSFGIFGKSGTKIRLVSWVGSDEQKKTKDLSRFLNSRRVAVRTATYVKRISTARNNQCYIGITSHWLTPNMELYDILICIDLIKYSHTAKNIRSALVKKIQELHLNDKVKHAVTDNGQM